MKDDDNDAACCDTLEQLEVTGAFVVHLFQQKQSVKTRVLIETATIGLLFKV